jgi:hypothetical protein
VSLQFVPDDAVVVVVAEVGDEYPPVVVVVASVGGLYAPLVVVVVASVGPL